MLPGAFQTLAGHYGHSEIFTGTLSHMEKQRCSSPGQCWGAGSIYCNCIELQPFKTEGREPLAKSLWCSAPNLSWWACHSVLGPQFERLLIHLVFGKPHWVIGQNAACSCLGSGKRPSVSPFELNLGECISPKATLSSFPLEESKGHLVARATNCSIDKISLNSRSSPSGQKHCTVTCEVA